MKKEESKVVIIGLGYLATYIMPCYKKLLGKNIGTNLIGIKGSERGLKEKQQICPFPVVVGNVWVHLNEREPDIIVLAVKPDQIADMTEQTLVPYYQKLRDEKKKLPDLYSFAPDPSVDYFYDTLGSDVNAANMIPNMVSDIEGYDVSQVGVSFVAFDPRRIWPEENKRAALEFMTPTGTVLMVDGDKAIPFLACQCACHLMFEFNYIAQDVQAEIGRNMSLAESASAYRSVFREIFNESCVKVLPCSQGAADKKLLEFMEMLMKSWYNGVLKFAGSENIPNDAAHRLICGTMETYQMEAQLEKKETLVQNTKNHATPGGFLEMCLITFHKRGYDYITGELKNWLAGKKDPNAEMTIEEIAYDVARSISEHGKTVSGVKKK